MNIPHAALNLFRKAKWPEHRVFRHVAVVVRGGAVVAVGCNSDTTHAEVAALNRLWPSERRGVRVWSVRMNKKGELRIARPCPNCMRYLRESGVRTVYWTDSQGDVRSEKP